MESNKFNFTDIQRNKLPKILVPTRWVENLRNQVVFNLENDFQLQIRRMESDDIDQVMKLEEQIFPSPWSAESFSYRLEEKNFNMSIVGLSDNRIIAYAVSYVVFDEFHFSNIAVEKRFRGKKIGETLLWLSLQIGVEYNCSFVQLEVRESNRQAIRLYEKYGFKKTGLRKNYYARENEDALLMSKEINWEIPYGMV